MAIEVEDGAKNESIAGSLPSVLEEDEGISEALPLELEAKNGDAFLISETMAEEEEKLLEARENEKAAVKLDPNFKFDKLDELLTQTKLYSEFLLEKMDDITADAIENKIEEEDTLKEEEEAPKGKKGRKRKATKSATKYNTRRAKTAVAAMLTRSHETIAPEDACLTEEERAAKEQAELVPLMTGGKLKSYQIKGVKWLISLWQNGLNGILADQMGLGKTVQTIGFLAHLKGKGLDGPYMIIAPLSTLSNWVNEVRRFVPSMSTSIYHGNQQERTDIRKKYMPKSVGSKFPLVITSYEIALRDARKLSQYKWKYVVVDEGHRLKNMNCLLLRELKRLPIENKLLLTGTPLQNNLAELWSLLNFILPDIFSSHSQFEAWFDLSGRSNNDPQQEDVEEKRRVEVVSKLHAILRPFLLRRMKVDVEKNLPQKKEIILYANMTDHQKKIQDHLANKTFEDYVEETAAGLSKHGMRGKLNNLFIQLRKNCSHPDLLQSQYDGSFLYPPAEQLVEQCGKFQLLDRLVALLLSRKHKVLIFSQWTKVLDLLECYFNEKSIEVCRIDGSVKLDERRRQIDAFNDLNSSVSVFLLSTRAGGLGINLTAADTCILYDSDWNPQMDLQAMDRCHRIGQTRPVHVYRLATSHSVEGRIIKKAFGKLKLEHVVIAKGQFQQDSVKPNTLEEAELLALLRDEEDEEDKLTQTDISDEDLLRVLDRSDLVSGTGDCHEVKPEEAAAGSLPLRGPGWELLVDKKMKRVVFAEADKDFVDILFSFLALPLGTIIRRLGKQSALGSSMDNLYESIESLDAASASKAERKVLCAGAGEDFADLVLSYLTLPLGSVIKLLDVNSSIGCVENLYRSVQALSSDYIKSDECRDMLLSPKLAPFFGYNKQLLKIDEMPPKRSTEIGRCFNCKWNNTLCKHGVYNYLFIELNPKLPSGKSEQGGGYAKGPGKFMVTNDLHVSLLTPVSTTQFISSQGLPFSKLEEKEANIDLPQALNLLKAALTSKTPLNDVFGPAQNPAQK